MSNHLKKLVILPAAFAVYSVVLRFVAPGSDPYFMLGFGVIGCAAGLYGIVAGLATAALLFPLTTHIYGQFEVSISYISFALSPAYIGTEILMAAALGLVRRKSRQLKAMHKQLAESTANMQATLNRVREIGGIHTICSSCKQFQDDDGTWMKTEDYLLAKTKIEFSHAICPDCASAYAAQPEQS